MFLSGMKLAAQRLVLQGLTGFFWAISWIKIPNALPCALSSGESFALGVARRKDGGSLYMFSGLLRWLFEEAHVSLPHGTKAWLPPATALFPAFPGG